MFFCDQLNFATPQRIENYPDVIYLILQVIFASSFILIIKWAQLRDRISRVLTSADERASAAALREWQASRSDG